MGYGVGMTYASLGSYVDALEAAGELHRIKQPVSPLLEVTEITDRVSKSLAPGQSEDAAGFDPRHHGLGGKALLFEDVQGCDYPLLINAFGRLHILDGAFRTLKC